MNFRNKGLRYWLPYYLWQKLLPREKPDPGKPVHIIFCLVDHFEPFHDATTFEKAKWRVNQWVKHYPRMSENFQDADGRHPQHTWFYPPHLDHCFLEDLVGLCRAGYGEVEMHLHHNHMEPFPDTSITLRGKIQKCLDDYSKFDIFCLPNGDQKFAFIHGDWSLDNAAGPKICGINDEITILKELGCFADFTFPSINKCQPKMVNCIYYCKDNPTAPKSYDIGIPVVAGVKSIDVDLMMITGPIGLRWNEKNFGLPAIESGSFGYLNRPTPKRIDVWVNTHIHVRGCPDWVFVKIHTHGGPRFNHDVNFGNDANVMYSYLCSKYNDGIEYFLHFVTAREMYNIIKAAESGCKGNPASYRDYIIPKYIYLGE